MQDSIYLTIKLFISQTNAFLCDQKKLSDFFYQTNILISNKCIYFGEKYLLFSEIQINNCFHK